MIKHTFLAAFVLLATFCSQKVNAEPHFLRRNLQKCRKPGKDAKYCNANEYDPVACGTNHACIYDSMCIGLSTKYKNCEHICPAPGGGMACADIYEPVACGDGFACRYDNACLANGAGFVNCLPIDESCPLPGGGIDCSNEYRPVICDQSCQYNNACLANAAGYAYNACVEIPLPCNPTTGANCPSVTPPPPCNPTTNANC